MDVKDKKIGLILNNLNDITLKQIERKIKEIKKLRAKIIKMNKIIIEEDIITTVNEFEDVDIIVIISCTRHLCQQTNRK